MTLSVSNWIGPFRSFYDNTFDTKCPGLKQINNTLCQYRSLLGNAIAQPMLTMNQEAETQLEYKIEQRRKGYDIVFLNLN